MGLVLVLHDTSELRGLTRQMTYQASHDALTGLVNRREFERRLQEALDLAQTGDTAHALCYLDLDRFKVVNDTCGHTAGDNMLREVASIIKEAVRDSDTVGRLGGDEFALLLVGCPLEKARQIAASSNLNYLQSLLFRYHDTFPRPEGIPQWPELLPDYNEEIIEFLIAEELMICGDPDEVLAQCKRWEAAL